MMVYFSELATAFMTALVLENLLFTRAIDIPSLYEKRTPGQIILIGSVLTGIIAVCSIPSYFLNRFLGSQSSLSRFLTLGLLIDRQHARPPPFGVDRPAKGCLQFIQKQGFVLHPTRIGGADSHRARYRKK